MPPVATARPQRAAARGRAGAARLRPGSVRWDRVGRVAVLAVLGVILLLYVSPLQQWMTQRRTASEHRAELHRLEAEHARLKARADELTRTDAIEREARRLGMVRQGERAYVIENAPR